MKVRPGTPEDNPQGPGELDLHGKRLDNEGVSGDAAIAPMSLATLCCGDGQAGRELA
jgi:hypothetical protein